MQITYETKQLILRTSDISLSLLEVRHFIQEPTRKRN
jgi:hypothetical protein